MSVSLEGDVRGDEVSTWIVTQVAKETAFEMQQAGQTVRGFESHTILWLNTHMWQSGNCDRL